MFPNANWIACEKFETPVIRRDFTVTHPTQAELFITGLGYFEARINGKPVTDDLFLPAQTDYHSRDTSKFSYPIHDRMAYRVQYLKFDVTELLVCGENTLEITLGNGWYRQTVRTAEGNMNYGQSLKALYELNIQTPDGCQAVFSDGSELYGESAILESNLFKGEVIDLRQRVAFTEQVKTVEMDTRLVLQECPCDRVTGEIEPKLVYKDSDTCIYDNGINITGVVAVTTHCPEGEAVTLSFSENLNEDGTDLDPESAGGWGQLQQDRFINDGGTNTFTPKFVYHCFRYFKITGDFQSLKTLAIHTEVPDISVFESDHPALNWLYDAFGRTLLNNLHGCIPSDCPHRERLGYTGDGQLTAEAAMYCFDLSGAYRKWIGDIFDGQGENGHIQHTAPFQGGGGGPAGWGGAAVVLPYQHYRFYGDKAFLEETYPKTVKWIGYMRSRCADGRIVREEDGGWCLGDWGSETQPQIDPAYVNTALFVRLLEMAVELAEVIGNTQDAVTFRQYRDEHKQAILRHHYDPETGDFCENVQFANIFALTVGLGDERTKDHLYALLDQTVGKLDIGISAMDQLIHYLFRQGEPDRAVRAIELLVGPMMGAGATTVWEYPYKPHISNCHHMFCGMVRSLFSELLGIRLSLNGAVTFDPRCQLPDCMHFASGQTVLRGQKVYSVIRRVGETVTAEQSLRKDD